MFFFVHPSIARNSFSTQARPKKIYIYFYTPFTVANKENKIEEKKCVERK